MVEDGTVEKYNGSIGEILLDDNTTRVTFNKGCIIGDTAISVGDRVHVVYGYTHSDHLLGGPIATSVEKAA